MVEELARYIREQGLSKPVVVGHSMGGFSALMLAQQRPELVGAVMSVDSLPFFSALFGHETTEETARPYAEQAAAGMLAADDAAFRAGQAASAAGLSRDPATRDVDSRRLLAEVLTRLASSGVIPDSIDVTITGARPRLGGRRLDAIAGSIAVPLPKGWTGRSGGYLRDQHDSGAGPKRNATWTQK